MGDSTRLFHKHFYFISKTRTHFTGAVFRIRHIQHCESSCRRQVVDPKLSDLENQKTKRSLGYNNSLKKDELTGISPRRAQGKAKQVLYFTGYKALSGVLEENWSSCLQCYKWIRAENNGILNERHLYECNKKPPYLGSGKAEHWHWLVLCSHHVLRLNNNNKKKKSLVTKNKTEENESMEQSLGLLCPGCDFSSGCEDFKKPLEFAWNQINPNRN